MTPDGKPERFGEVMKQAGATALAVREEDGSLVWRVHQNGAVSTTAALAHVGHWSPT